MENKAINIEDKFQMMSEIDHVLHRPGLYLGNVHFEVIPYRLFKPSANAIESLPNVPYNAGLLKLIDEVLTNSIDERLRKSRLFDITQIDVFVSTTGRVVVRDNGGIPIVVHKGTGLYLPKMIFGTLRTSANYGGDGDRVGAGLNGLGAKLTNIYATRFKVTSCDEKNKMEIQWNTNMKVVEYEKVTPVKNGEHFTETDWDIELSRFDIESLDLGTIRVIQKRCIDAAAANPGLVVNFKTDIAEGKLDSTWHFNTFKEFVQLHTNQPLHDFTSTSGKDNIILTTDIGYNFGFVNGAVCSDGTHMRKIQNQVIKKVLEILKKKDIELITDTDIRSRLTIFCSTFILNPDYDSQSKDKLANKLLTSTLLMSDKFLDTLADSELVTQLVDYYNIKYLAEQKKELRKLNATLKNTKSNKLITCSSRTSEDTELWLFEGTSASEGFEGARNPQTQAAYLLRGKVKNTMSLAKAEIVANQELREIIAALKLQFNDPKGNLKNCPFKKIIFATDADFDGSHISGLLIVFFARLFPELFVAGRIFRVLSPIIIAEKNNVEKFYYTQEDYEKDIPNLKGWEINYKKGLGALEDHHYEEMVGNKRLEQFTLNKDYMDDIGVWFSKSTEQRKAILGEESNMQDFE